jgi:hypothetical protein
VEIDLPLSPSPNSCVEILPLNVLVLHKGDGVSVESSRMGLVLL